MGVAAARTALAGAPDGVRLRSLWFSTVAPPYLDKTNATAVHAALRLPADAPAYDMNGAVRSAAGALWAGMATGRPALVVGADMRTGRPGSPDEATGGDAASALLVGTADDGPLLAEVIGDRRRHRGVPRPLAHPRRRRLEAVGGALRRDPLRRSRHRRLGGRPRRRRPHRRPGRPGGDRHLARPGRHRARQEAGARRPAGRRARRHRRLHRRRPARPAAGPRPRRRHAPARSSPWSSWPTGPTSCCSAPPTHWPPAARSPSVADQVAAGAPIAYGKYLAWRGFLPVEPPRRPEPARPSASAAGRSADWKFGFVGSQDADGEVHLPPGPGRRRRPARWPTPPARS